MQDEQQHETGLSESDLQIFTGLSADINRGCDHFWRSRGGDPVANDREKKRSISARLKGTVKAIA